MKRRQTHTTFTPSHLTGARLGDYEVRERLGSGGMASVYKGYDTVLDREVAIKIIDTSEQPADFVVRFSREARVAANLRHPNIVQIYFFGEQQGIVYMVQELLSGSTLAQYIHESGNRPLAAKRVHAVIRELANALDFAHGQGVIHRDVKPSNAIYNAHGQLVLTDFGIARSPADASRTATGPGVVMGTPGYVAPEQAVSSTALTRACDIYSLGVVLFELLTGRLPFDADTPMGVVLKHLYDQPPRPSSVRPDLPKALDDVVLKALHKEPGERYPSCDSLFQALQSAWPASNTAPSRARSTQAAPKVVPQRREARERSGTASSVPKPVARSHVRATPSNGTGKLSVKRDTPARVAKSTSPVVARPRSNLVDPVSNTEIMQRVRVGLFTINMVAALILFGIIPNPLGAALRGLHVLLRLIGIRI